MNYPAGMTETELAKLEGKKGIQERIKAIDKRFITLEKNAKKIEHGKLYCELVKLNNERSELVRTLEIIN